MSLDLTVDAEKAAEHGEPAHAKRPPVPLGDRVPPATGRHGKRKRTGGEMLFDLTTYGGLALLGNELVSTYIVNQAEKPTAFGRFYERASEACKKIGPAGKMPYTQAGRHSRFNYINFAIIGGFIMVPFIKFLEDNKGRIVRRLDSFIHGAKADDNPDIRHAHEEMDNAPKQTWGSLMKGRLLTVAAAWGVDASINWGPKADQGWEGGWSARALKGTRFEKYSSLESITSRIADRMGGSIGTRRGMDATQTKGLKELLTKGFGLLSLSATLTAIFYVMSKFFAKRSDDRREIYDEIHATRADHEKANASPQPAAAKDEAPVPTVNAIAHESRIANPELGREA